MLLIAIYLQSLVNKALEKTRLMGDIIDEMDAIEDQINSGELSSSDLDTAYANYNVLYEKIAGKLHFTLALFTITKHLFKIII